MTQTQQARKPVEARPPIALADGRFVVTERLGEGGTASVYLAWDRDERCWWALKALKYKYCHDREMKRRFQLEAETVMRLAHPSVPRLITIRPDATPPFIVMELCRGGTVMDYLKRHGPMSASLAVQAILPVCDVLAVAHEIGIVHRDVKPHNFLIGEDNRVRLADFGIAHMEEMTRLTDTGSQIGTFSFMSPEQRKDSATVDARADIYSMGATLYTMITGQISAELFVADSDDALLDPVPTAFRRVIVKATQYAKQNRYATITDFRDALIGAIARSTPEPGPFVLCDPPPPPLPDHPPDLLDNDGRYEDLLRALSLDLDEVTYVPSAHATGQSSSLRPPKQLAAPVGEIDPDSDDLAPLDERSHRSLRIRRQDLPSNVVALPAVDLPAEVEEPAPAAPPPPQVTHPSSKGSKAPLPYVMPEKQVTDESTLPDYLDPEDWDRASAVVVSPLEITPPPTARSRRDLRQLAALLAGLGLGIVCVAAAAVGVGVIEVRGAAAEDDARLQAFYAAISQEAPVLVAKGLAADRLPNRDEASALGFTRDVGTDAELLGRAPERVARLVAARDDWLAAREAWRQATDHPPGSFAAWSGLAPTPPPGDARLAAAAPLSP